MRISRHLPILLILIFVLAAASNYVMVREFKANIPDASKNEIHLMWVSENESNLNQYVLKRKMVSDSDFNLIAEVQPQSTAAGVKTYNYVDRNVFRNNADNNEPVVYELHAVFTNGQKEFIGQAEVNYSSTAIRRTWGSIKAMFQ